jgi:hypothetical protein
MAANNNSCTSHSTGGTRASLDHGKTGRKRLFTLLKLALLIALGVSSACATVKPYEREYLSRPSMDRENERTEAMFYSHVLDAREGATGGVGTAGGGCGCN